MTEFQNLTKNTKEHLYVSVTEGNVTISEIALSDESEISSDANETTENVFDLYDSVGYTTEIPESITFEEETNLFDFIEETTEFEVATEISTPHTSTNTYAPIDEGEDLTATTQMNDETEFQPIDEKFEATTFGSMDPESQDGAIPSTETNWGYNAPQDSSAWPELFEGCSSGLQSPINISPLATKPAHYPPLSFRHHTTSATATLTNDGRMAWVELTEAVRPEVAGGGLEEAYAVRGLAFRWGGGAERGSEHTINYVRYPLEIQLTLVSTRYPSAGAALGHPQGLGALGLLATAGELEHPWLAAVVRGLEAVRSPGSSTPIVLPPLSSLLPNSTELFYRYTGGLTSPPCPGPVTWTLLDDSVPVSHSQVAAFRRLLDRSGAPLQDNFRSTQPRAGRPIYRSTEMFK